MTHANFQHLLSLAAVTTGSSLTEGERKKPVIVQWDPERSPALKVMPYRSIQIGIKSEIVKQWAVEWIESIEDVTEKALLLRDAILRNPEVAVEELVSQELVPVERNYEVPAELRSILRMDEDS